MSPWQTTLQAQPVSSNNRKNQNNWTRRAVHPLPNSDNNKTIHPRKLTWLMAKQPFEDVFRIKDGDFPASHVTFPVSRSMFRFHVSFQTLATPKLQSLHSRLVSPVNVKPKMVTCPWSKSKKFLRNNKRLIQKTLGSSAFDSDWSVSKA